MIRLICKILFVFALFGLMPTVPAVAQEGVEVGSVTNLPIPRMVSLRSDKVYVRSGPGMRYPIKWVYKRRDLPVSVTREFGTWRRVMDFEGEEGWVHQSLLSSRRFAIARVEPDRTVYLFRKPDDKARRRAVIEDQAIVRLEREDPVCEDGWCSVSSSGFKGWVEEKFLWGVDAGNESDKSD